MALFPLVKVDDVTHIIQLSVAPVFLLTAVATIIGVLINRLARIVDRTRMLEEQLRHLASDDAGSRHFELGILGRRLKLIYMAVSCEVICGLFVGLSIVSTFIDAFLMAKLAGLIAVLFILAMLAFISGLVIFLREIFLAVAGIVPRTR